VSRAASGFCSGRVRFGPAEAGPYVRSWAPALVGPNSEPNVNVNTNREARTEKRERHRVRDNPEMPDTRHVAVLVGSLRKASFNRKTALAVAALAPASLKLEIVEIGDLPLYNEDLENANPTPAAWLAFRDTVRAANAVLFVTPEYNRSVPGVLKNAIDVGSRPYGQSVWSGKPCGVISVSPGAIGAFGANQHIRQSFVFLDMPTMQQPETYIGNAASLFDPDGKLINDGTRQLLEKFITRFEKWVEIHL
jgi:chromate reductase, NAD(P)H dehydrogenase (quinone)